MTVRIIFVRHGRSRADDEGVHEGRYDSPLTEVGRRQVQERAGHFQACGIQPDAVICSPLMRARESAEIIARALSARVEADSDWMEIDNGPLAGMDFHLAEAQYPRPAFRNPYEPFWGTGESDWQIYARAARAVESVVRRGKGLYLVVAHGGILNAALRTITGAGPAVNYQGCWFEFGDAGYVQTVYHPEKHQWWITKVLPGE
jgi:2,3-bisphosphoglycerate-dependent phosphoglycerate mutase